VGGITCQIANCGLMVSVPATELQGRKLIFQPLLLNPCCFLHSSATWSVYCHQHFNGPSAATWEWEETTYNSLIAKQEQNAAARRGEYLTEELCVIPGIQKLL